MIVTIDNKLHKKEKRITIRYSTGMYRTFFISVLWNDIFEKMCFLLRTVTRLYSINTVTLLLKNQNGRALLLNTPRAEFLKCTSYLCASLNGSGTGLIQTRYDWMIVVFKTVFRDVPTRHDRGSSYISANQTGQK